jgi:hypothetical protein
MKTNPNDSTYPLIETVERGGEHWYADTYSIGGLSKREYFTGQAIIGLLSNSHPDVIDKHCVNGGWLHPETVAKIAVQIADATIIELNKVSDEETTL